MNSPGALFWSPFLAWCSVLDFNTSPGLGAIQTSGGEAKKSLLRSVTAVSDSQLCFWQLKDTTLQKRV